MRVAIIGTFDLQNYGDLLFPVLARHELSRRLPDIEIVAYSYRSKEASQWPYAVRPIEEFPRDLAGIDGVVIGGGHLVRFDHELAPEYAPAPGVHHPTGLWLVPPLLAASAGRPVVWNGIGASPDFEDWGIGLLRCTLEASALVTARDKASQATLRAVTDRIKVTVVPDSAFGVADLLEGTASELARWREGQGVDGPYVVIQPSPKLESVKEDLLGELDSLRADGLTLVEAPVGPVLGDRPGLLPAQWTQVVRLEPWPDPRLLAIIIAHAEAAVGVSLHLGITAICHGVPLHRPRCWPGSKYEILGEFPGVYQFDEHGSRPRVGLEGRLGRRDVSHEVEAQRHRLKRHWDEIADALQEGRSESAFDAVGRFFFDLPFVLIDAEVARQEAYSSTQDLRQQVDAEQKRRKAAVRSASEQLERESGLRKQLQEGNDKLERELGDLTAAVAKLASLQSKTDAARATLARELEQIHRSRAWRTSVALRKLFRAVTGPWSRLRTALSRGDSETGLPPSSP